MHSSPDPSRNREGDTSPYSAPHVNSAFYPTGVGKLMTTRDRRDSYATRVTCFFKHWQITHEDYFNLPEL